MAGLVHVPEVHRGADPDLPTVRVGRRVGDALVGGHQHPEQGGLSGPVASDHPDDPGRRERERQILDEELVAEAFA